MKDQSASVLADMDAAATAAAELLRLLANPGRLRILCALYPGEMTVGALVDALDCRQAYVSGQLARLRAEGLVSARREGRSIHYVLCDPRVRPIIAQLHAVFCPGSAAD